MIIVKMNDSTLECSIAASELREIGITAEAFMRDEESVGAFMSQLNKEVGEQLQYNPESEVLLMSKNLQPDGSVRIFAIKMNNDDIDRAAERIREAAVNLAGLVDETRIEAIKEMPNRQKGEALGLMFMGVTEQINHIYIAGDEKSADMPVATRKNVAKYDRYTIHFDSMEAAIHFAHVVKEYPIKESALYKTGDGFFLMVRIKNSDDRKIFDFRKAAIEYGNELIYDSPEELHISESGETIIAKKAIEHLAKLSNCSL